jgi:hypothetical protein
MRGVVAAVLAGALIGFFALFWGRSPAPRYVFVDCGAHEGETILGFEKSTLFKKHAWSMVSFEPNPSLFPGLPQRPYLRTMRATSANLYLGMALEGDAGPASLRSTRLRQFHAWWIIVSGADQG